MRNSAVEEEFTAFVQTHRATLSRIAVLLTGNRPAAEDLFQDALVRTYLAWERIQPGGHVAYARRVLVNLATDSWRRRRYETVPVDLDDNRPSGAAASALKGVEDRDQIVRELGVLTRRERAAIVLRYYADLSEAQVAEELGISVGTVKSTCSRALARLRPGAEPRADYVRSQS